MNFDKYWFRTFRVFEVYLICTQNSDKVYIYIYIYICVCVYVCVCVCVVGWLVGWVYDVLTLVGLFNAKISLFFKQLYCFKLIIIRRRMSFSQQH